jgi:hypothetical protein
LSAAPQEIIMRRQLFTFVLLSMLAIVGTQSAYAGEEMFDVDSKWRAKIAKEKLKQSDMRRQGMDGKDGSSSGDGECGSQSIGNVDTSKARPGMAPREVFVFVPNAINIVNGRGCR